MGLQRRPDQARALACRRNGRRAASKSNVINVAIQLLTLLCGLLVNFLVPFVYGLEAYGAFIQANILVFVFQKLVDIVNEPLIGQADSLQVFPLAMVMAVCIWIVFAAVNHFFVSLGSPLLLATMLASASVTLGMYSLRWHRCLVACLGAFAVIFLVLVALREWANWPLDIVDVLVWTNGLTMLPVLIFLTGRTHWAGGGALFARTLRGVPGNISVTLVFNLFTNLLPYLLSKSLSHADLGLFRVTTSIVQSATSVFPINVKALFVMFRRDEEVARLYRYLLGLALAWFSGVACVALAFTLMMPNLAPYFSLVGALPVLYWSVLSERYLLAAGHRHFVAGVNWVIGAVALTVALRVPTLEQALLLYAISFAAYAFCTLSRAIHGRMRWIALGLVVAMSAAVYFQAAYPEAALLWHLALVVVAIKIFKLTPDNLRRLGARL